MAPSRSGLLRPAIPINDSEIESFIKGTSNTGLREWCENEDSPKEFFQLAEKWLSSFIGVNSLSKFASHFLTTGTTGSFQNFYQIHSHRRLRILPGEYPFHRDLFTQLGLAWKWLDITDLEVNDFVVLSVPFSGDGNIHPLLFPVLQRCEQLQIPVLLDCAFAGLTNGPLPEVSSYQCVHTLSFSLSKFFNIGHVRCGFEFSIYDKGANALLNQWDYGPKAAAFLGLQLMQKFPLGFLYEKYREQQLRICQEKKLTASSTILFGLGDSSWNEFSRDGFANRVCLSELFYTPAVAQ